MAGDCAHTNARYADAETFCPSEPWSGGDRERSGEMEVSKGRGPPAPRSANFEVIDGLLYRKKLERGFINYREVLDEDRRPEALSTFHRRRRPGQRHLSLEETYKCVAENYWWEGMNITACLTSDLLGQHVVPDSLQVILPIYVTEGFVHFLLLGSVGTFVTAKNH